MPAAAVLASYAVTLISLDVFSFCYKAAKMSYIDLVMAVGNLRSNKAPFIGESNESNRSNKPSKNQTAQGHLIDSSFELLSEFVNTETLKNEEVSENKRLDILKFLSKNTLFVWMGVELYSRHTFQKPAEKPQTA